MVRMPGTLSVELSLLARIWDDVRCIMHLAGLGYGIPSCTLAASVYEAANTVGYIGQDEGLAAEWLVNYVPGKQFRRIKPLTRGSLTNHGFESQELDEVVGRAYGGYRFLCNFKHPSKFTLQIARVGTEHRDLAARYGPDLTRLGVAACACALRMSANWARYGGVMVLQHACSHPEASGLKGDLHETAEGIALGELELSRYAKGDPAESLIQ